MKLTKFSSLSMLLILFFSVGNLLAQTVTAEELLTKHLDSIGSTANREAVKTRIIVSDAEFVLQKQNPISGRFIIASNNEGAIYGINLETNEYRLDKFSYDGKKVRVGYIRPGIRSFLGNFILSYGALLKEGLLGGTLSSSWALLNNEARKAKLSYKGTEKIDGNETYSIEYVPKNTSDLYIKMYFDSQNFRHVRTEYSRVIGARMGGGVDNSANNVETRYKLVEDFSNYKKFGQLTLPSSYSINYTIAGGALTTNYVWKFKVTDASFNQPLGDGAFDIDAK